MSRIRYFCFSTVILLTLPIGIYSIALPQELQEQAEAIAEDTQGKDKLYHPLSCRYERTGEILGKSFNEPNKLINCSPDVKFCQKVKANYISVGEITQITMRDCGRIKVDGSYMGVECESEGCKEIYDNDEQYMVCCCSSDECNAASIRSPYLSAIYLALAFLIYYVIF